MTVSEERFLFRGTACVLVASCLGESSGGGLVAFDGKNTEVIDTVSTTGLLVTDDRVLRLLWCRGDFAAPGELLVYDTAGIERYYRIDSLNDPHDIAWDGTHYLVASAGENSILWIAKNGDLARKATFPGQADSWHINSLYFHDGELFVAAFGRFTTYREWVQHAGEPRGIVFRHTTGQDVIVGLDRPHHPRVLNGEWLICNSGRRELVQANEQTIMRRTQLEKWTRGLTFSDRYIFVGESARRHRPHGDADADLGSIAVLDRESWQVVDRIPLPFEEVYDLVLVPQPLLQGLQRGFKTNPQRVMEQNQLALFTKMGLKAADLWAASDLVPKEACRTTVSVEVGPVLAANCILRLPCTLNNHGPRILVSVKPLPVVVTYRWRNKKTAGYLRALAVSTRLPAPLVPGGSVSCNLRLRTPALAGDYELEVCLFQRGRGFFSDVDPMNAFRANVKIRGAE